MWLMTRFGFFSAVCGKEITKQGKKYPVKLNPEHIMLRARSREHLVKLHDAFPTLVPGEIAESYKADYRYRVHLKRADFVRLVTELALDVDYGNFKGKCADEGCEPGYLDFLSSVWGAGLRMQPYRKKQKETPLFDKDK